MTNIIRLSPHTPATVICEEEVTVARLQTLLTAAVIESSVDDDGDLYVTEGLEYPAWIRIRPHGKFVGFFSYFKPDKSGERNWYEVINEMNSELLLVQFYWEENSLCGDYVMRYDGGLNGRQLIKSLRDFSSSFKVGARMAVDDERTVGRLSSLQ